MEDFYIAYREKFQKYRTLCEIGFRLMLMRDQWKEDEEKIKAAYARASIKDIRFLKIWIRNRVKGSGL